VPYIKVGYHLSTEVNYESSRLSNRLRTEIRSMDLPNTKQEATILRRHRGPEVCSVNVRSTGVLSEYGYEPVDFIKKTRYVLAS
jgi:hypothetical protein